MAEEPENLVLQLLREIDGRLDSIMQRLTNVESRIDDGFNTVRQRVEDIRREIARSLDLIGQADDQTLERR